MYAVFFWDEVRANVIGVTWKPVCFIPTAKFSVLQSKHLMTVHGTSEESGHSGALLVANISAMVCEMVALSNGLVEDVEYL